jgi:tRNA-dihydrouridine synthase
MRDFLVKQRPALVLAPMQNVTDLPFMRVCDRRGGPDWFVTEFFRIHSVAKLDPYILRSITENSTRKPVFAQIIGSDTESMVRAAQELEKYPIAGVDLNLGCPSPTVCGQTAGGGLLRHPQGIDRMVGELRQAISGRFTIKTRLGYHDPAEFSQLLEVFRKHAIDGITIHARTVTDRYLTPVRPNGICMAVATLSCPVIANGNVVNASAGKNFIERTAAHGLMIGRGAIRNPWIFDQIRAHYLGKQVFQPRAVDLLEYIEDLYHELARESYDFDATKHVQRMKKTMMYIAQGLGEDFEYHLRRVSQESEFFELCRSHLNHQDPLLDVPPEKSKLFCGFEELLDQQSVTP